MSWSRATLAMVRRAFLPRARWPSTWESPDWRWISRSQSSTLKVISGRNRVREHLWRPLFPRPSWARTSRTRIQRSTDRPGFQTARERFRTSALENNLTSGRWAPERAFPWFLDSPQSMNFLSAFGNGSGRRCSPEGVLICFATHRAVATLICVRRLPRTSVILEGHTVTPIKSWLSGECNKPWWSAPWRCWIPASPCGLKIPVFTKLEESLF